MKNREKKVNKMSFESALIYDMDYIVKEIDSIETKELEKIQNSTKMFINILNDELIFRKDESK